MSQPASLRVMLVEDDPQFIYLVQRYVRTSGCQLVEARSGSDVLHLALSERPHLILLDMGPRPGDRWRVLAALKADPIARTIPVFVCSAGELAADECEEQAEGYLLKPVMYEDFLAALARVQSRPMADTQ